MYHLEIVTPPASEPVTTAELKAHLRLNTTDEDTLLAGYIAAARTQFETLSNRAVMLQTLRLHLDEWPDTCIYLVRPPLSSFTSLKYYDPDETLTTLVSGTDYDLDAKREPARVWLRQLPTLSSYTAPTIQANYVAGYASADAVPAPIKQAILLLASSYFANRESLVERPLSELPNGFRAVVDQYKIQWVSDMGMK